VLTRVAKAEIRLKDYTKVTHVGLGNSTLNKTILEHANSMVRKLAAIKIIVLVHVKNMCSTRGRVVNNSEAQGFGGNTRKHSFKVRFLVVTIEIDSKLASAT
jgi:hypothetical protein